MNDSKERAVAVMSKFQARVKNIPYAEGSPEYEREISRIRIEALHELPNNQAEQKKFQPPKNFSQKTVQSLLHIVSGATTHAIMCSAVDKTDEAENMTSNLGVLCACYDLPDLLEDVQHIQEYIQTMHKILDAYKSLGIRSNAKIDELLKKQSELEENIKSVLTVNELRTKQLSEIKVFDCWITVPKAMEIIQDMVKYSLVPVDKPICSYGTLRKKIQDDLNKNKCDAVPVKGRGGKYFRCIDVAKAAEKYYRSFTAAQYQRDFDQAAVLRDDIPE